MEKSRRTQAERRNDIVQSSGDVDEEGGDGVGERVDVELPLCEFASLRSFYLDVVYLHRSIGHGIDDGGDGGLNAGSHDGFLGLGGGGSQGGSGGIWTWISSLMNTTVEADANGTHLSRRSVLGQWHRGR